MSDFSHRKTLHIAAHQEDAPTRQCSSQPASSVFIENILLQVNHIVTIVIDGHQVFCIVNEITGAHVVYVTINKLHPGNQTLPDYILHKLSFYVESTRITSIIQ